MADSIDHPPYYIAGGIEAIDVIEAFGLDFALGNVVKYVLRAGRKRDSSMVEDLRKAAWYLQHAIIRLTRPRLEEVDEEEDDE